MFKESSYAAQELLVKTICLPEAPALEAWTEWQKDNSVKDPFAYNVSRLFPAVYLRLKNLEALEATDPELDLLKEQYMSTWAKTQLLYNKSLSAFDALAEANIEVMFIKGMGMIVQFYQDWGRRPTRDIDILVPVNKSAQAIALLKARGLVERMDCTHAVSLKIDPTTEIDLHRYLLSDWTSSEVNERFWEGAIEVEFEGRKVLTLNPTDLLFLIIAHGAQRFATDCYWVPDAIEIINSTKTSLDWDRIIAAARDHAVLNRLSLCLQYLKEEFEVPIDNAVITASENCTPRLVERIERTQYESVASGYRGGMIMRITRYYRRKGAITLQDTSLVSTLKHDFGLSSGLMLIPYMLKQILLACGRRIFRFLRSIFRT